jgi:hypothetical protein
MAKSRFRRKSYRKKTKTARRQKRKSRRMRGGAVIDKTNVLQWARNKNNRDCYLNISYPGTFKQVKGSIIADNEMKIEELKSYLHVPSNIHGDDLVLTSPCENTTAYDRMDDMWR